MNLPTRISPQVFKGSRCIHIKPLSLCDDIRALWMRSHWRGQVNGVDDGAGVQAGRTSGFGGVGGW